MKGKKKIINTNTNLLIIIIYLLIIIHTFKYTSRLNVYSSSEFVKF